MPRHTKEEKEFERLFLTKKNQSLVYSMMVHEYGKTKAAEEAAIQVFVKAYEEKDTRDKNLPIPVLLYRLAQKQLERAIH